MLDWLAPLAEMAGAGLGPIRSALPDGLMTFKPDRYEFYVLPALLALGGYWAWQQLEERRCQTVKRRVVEDDLGEPPTLHPLIDPAKCIGCGACVDACPEGKVIGIRKSKADELVVKAELIEPASCIGHGACKTACPAGAISLVFGTARRGVEIPLLSPTFETNVAGLYIAGELGGMGLIANAIEQGRQAVEAIRRRPASGPPGRWPLDLLIVGAGPAGFSASLAASEHGLRALAIEQESFGGTVAHYPRGKIIMTRPAVLPLHGKVYYRKVRKEKLIDLWASIARKHGIAVNYGEWVENITRHQEGFAVDTTRGRYFARTVLLANGRRGTPRKLEVPGEASPKVVYKLVDPVQYRGARVLVVGGGDSALEAALALAAEPGVRKVTLCHRGESFDRARPASRKKLENARQRGFVEVLLGTEVGAIHPDRVDILYGGRPYSLPNDAVIVCAGGVLPGAFLRRIGVEVEVRHGEVV